MCDMPHVQVDSDTSAGNTTGHKCVLTLRIHIYLDSSICDMTRLRVTCLMYRWFLTIAQAIALEIDKLCGLVGQLVGADYGDEVIYDLCTYSYIHVYMCSYDLY